MLLNARFDRSHRSTRGVSRRRVSCNPSRSFRPQLLDTETGYREKREEQQIAHCAAAAVFKTSSTSVGGKEPPRRRGRRQAMIRRRDTPHANKNQEAASGLLLDSLCALHVKLDPKPCQTALFHHVSFLRIYYVIMYSKQISTPACRLHFQFDAVVDITVAPTR